MTPKEKAFELYEEYKIATLVPVLDHSNTIEDANNIWKKCALIAVNDYLNFHLQLYINEGSIVYQYWQQVKQEIEKL